MSFLKARTLYKQMNVQCLELKAHPTRGRKTNDTSGIILLRISYFAERK